MQALRLFLIALFALLQGVAPLLHAHVKEDPHNGTGVHAPQAGPPVAWRADIPAAAPYQTPFVDLGEQLRRALPDLLAPPPAPPRAKAPATLAHAPPARPAPLRHTTQPDYTHPPALAPPRALA